MVLEKRGDVMVLCVCVLGERGDSGRVVLKLLIRSRGGEWSLVFHLRNAKRTRLVWGCEMRDRGIGVLVHLRRVRLGVIYQGITIFLKLRLQLSPYSRTFSLSILKMVSLISIPRYLP